MKENELKDLMNTIESFFKTETSDLDFKYEYEGDYKGDCANDSANYIIIVKNNPKALQTLVLLRNSMINSDMFSVYEFIEEQVADQIADEDEYLVADFYISKNR